MGGQPTPIEKKLLTQIYSNTLKQAGCRAKELAEQLSLDADYIDDLCRSMVRKGWLSQAEDGGYRLTEFGRSQIIVVFTGGVFDIIHPGHIHTLEHAKKLGDVLVVSVARDKTVVESKGRSPVNHEGERLRLVGSVRFVDAAVLGSEVDIYETVVWVKPDIIAVGYYQKHDEKVLIEECRRRGVAVKVVRLTTPMPDIKSSKLKKDIEVMKSF